ncbi:MAG TPA: hypothetical protein VGX02_02025 [Candidatus Eremiobacteraceae bacterium]|jgi:hypothetical protein|nr:hypothetical protein [Candidatus Eremiobacteraceae bacterium]
MKQQIVAVPNSIGDALDAIDRLADAGELGRASAETLELLCIWGWDDGFASVRRLDANELFAMSPPELKRALDDLVSRGFIQLRDAGECYAIEVTSLAVAAIAAGLGISWRRYYQVDIDTESDSGA